MDQGAVGARNALKTFVGAPLGIVLGLTLLVGLGLILAVHGDAMNRTMECWEGHVPARPQFLLGWASLGVFFLLPVLYFALRGFVFSSFVYPALITAATLSGIMWADTAATSVFTDARDNPPVRVDGFGKTHRMDFLPAYRNSAYCRSVRATL